MDVMQKTPILLFKYLLLKYLYNLSDNGVVERSRYDMSFKYFLELTPEEEVIHPSLLTKFRKQRLKDENILDLLINKSVELAINQGVLKSNTIIVDSTHTEARYHKTTQREMLKKASTSLKAALKDSDKDIYLPDEPEKRASLDEYNEYCHELLNTVQESPIQNCQRLKKNLLCYPKFWIIRLIVMINPLTRMPGLAIKRSILLFTDTKLIWP